ncbi:hypothetical protein GH714_000451 [Hevea brasiliensis]|uniref:Uncharacterized protein n=1 Tax=Hevea brasiliensis TaxID=3981 RepID=A0A6A6LYZ4_HEVBR|nr:hypothetical protein GH714_000451 [Hevea brasiliensis]
MSIAGRTMSKKASTVPTPHVIWFGWKLVIILSVSLSVFAILRLHFNSDFSSPVSSIYGSRSRISRGSFHFVGPPKIAFLFLVRKELPLDFLWGSFFEVVWGESSMIEAERLLLSAALDDPANQRFVLLSDSCVPLYNFSYIYSYLMASPRSFVDSFVDTKEERYNQKMSPIIRKHKWRKGSQWITLVRSHAEVIVDDEVIFPVFQKHCKRAPPPDASKGKLNPDINHVYYESEYRTEWCRSYATSVPCFLFARKFSRGAAMRLLSEGVVGPFDASALLATST